MKLIKALVFHRRNWPQVNEFNYSCNYISIKLPSSDGKNIKFFSLNRINLMSIYEKEFANGHKNLFDWCKKIIGEKYEENIDSVELITMPRILGYAFNPVSFIFCYFKSQLICTILKVNNTFSENHYYINYVENSELKHEQKYDIEKLFHVSPFLPREGYYKIKYSNDTDYIQFYIDYYDINNENILQTSISGRKKSVNQNNIVLRNIFTTAYLVMRVIYLIHLQAIKLYFKKAKFYKKPKQNEDRIT